MKKNDNILKSVVGECSKHLTRMNYAFERIKPLTPLTGEIIGTLENEDIAHIDQLIYRFTKLQDAVGQKLFKSVLISLGEQVYDLSAIDIFNRLEKLGVIEDYDRWKELRELRNELAHEYEEELNETADKLNTLIKRKTDLQDYYEKIIQYLKERKLIEN